MSLAVPTYKETYKITCTSSILSTIPQSISHSLSPSVCFFSVLFSKYEYYIGFRFLASRDSQVVFSCGHHLLIPVSNSCQSCAHMPKAVLLILIYYCRQRTLVLGNVTVSPCQQTPVSSTSVDEIVGW
jgi:hypothetical protein